MTPRSLQNVFRTLVDGPPVPDAELLQRFMTGDERAFGDLVRRHGRLVWAACCHLTRSEAEADDAFQATFLVLLKNARKVRDPAKLSSWLHGAAFRVCANARKAAAVRAAREQAAATPERNGHAVPGAAWDRALSAVHEEVPRLPENLRVPFVLCCLEGVPPTEAARQLGWNPSTLSVRLSRAKDALLARLDARGLTLGAVAGIGLAAPPTAAVARAAALAHAGSVIPASLLTLTHGVVGMSVNSIKALAAAALVACGVGGSVGGGWMASAGAQDRGGGASPAPAATKPDDTQAELKAVRAQMADLQRKLDDATAKLAQATGAEALSRLRAEAAMVQTQAARAEAGAVAQALTAELLAPPQVMFKTVRHEYILTGANGLDAARLQKLIVDHEARGWEFAGTVPIGESITGVFRKATAPVVANATTVAPSLFGGRVVDSNLVPSTSSNPLAAPTPAVSPTAGAAPASSAKPTPASTPAPATARRYAVTGDSAGGQGFQARPDEGTTLAGRLAEVAGLGMPSTPQSAAEAERLQAEINALQAKLAKFRVLPPQVVFTQASTGLAPSGLAQVLTDLGEKKFGPNGPSLHINMNGRDVTVSGSKEAVEWATGVVKLLTAGN